MTILCCIATLCTLVAALLFYATVVKCKNEIGELRSENESLKKQVAELAEKFEAADELIEAAKEREAEAVRSEKLFQDGIANIVNYDYMTAMKGNANGER